MTSPATCNTREHHAHVLTVNKIDTEAGFHGLEQTWNELLERTEFDSVFQMHQWYRTWWSVFGAGRRLYILDVRDGDTTVGIAPFMISGDTCPGTIEFIGAGNTDYADIIADKAAKRNVLAAVVDYLARHRSDWVDIVLSQITERSMTVGLMRGLLPDAGLRFRIDEIEQCYAFTYEGSEEDRESFDAGLGNYRNLRNSVNYFNKNGGMSYESLTDCDAIEFRLPQLIKFHWLRWKDTPTPSKFLNQADCDFYYQITRVFAPLNIARLETLFMGDTPVAYVYAFDYKNTIYLYTSALDVFYNKKSPGIVLYYQITDNYIRRGRESVDYLRGGEQYKGRLTNRAYSNFRISVYSSGLKHRMIGAYYRFKQTPLGRSLVGNATLKNIQLQLGSLKRQYGFAGLLKALPGRIWKRIFEYRVILVWTLGEPQPARQAKIPLTVRKMTADELDRVAAFYGAEPKTRKYQVLQDRFEQRADCYVGIHNDIIVGILWGEYKSSYLYEIDKTYRLKDDEIALVDGITLPQFRGYSVQPAMLGVAMRDWWNAGYKTLSFTMSTNESVFPVLRKSGGVVTGKVRSLRLFGKEVFKA